MLTYFLSISGWQKTSGLHPKILPDFAFPFSPRWPPMKVKVHPVYGSFRVFFVAYGAWTMWIFDKIFRLGVFLLNIGLGIEFWTSKMEFRTCFLEGFVNMFFLKDLFRE